MLKTAIQEKKINKIVRYQIVSALREILSDPDFGLLLQRQAVLRLKKSLASKKAGKLKPLSSVIKKYL